MTLNEFERKSKKIIANDGTIQYSLDGINFTNEIPKASISGTYKIIGDSNHLNSNFNSVEVVIEEKPEPIVIEIEEVTLDKSILNLEKGESETLIATINPSDTTQNKTITWSSDKEKIATVDENGFITYCKKNKTNRRADKTSRCR